MLLRRLAQAAPRRLTIVTVRGLSTGRPASAGSPSTLPVSTDPPRIQLFQALSLQKFNDDEIGRAYLMVYGRGAAASSSGGVGEGGSEGTLPVPSLQQQAHLLHLLKVNSLDLTPGDGKQVEQQQQQQQQQELGALSSSPAAAPPPSLAHFRTAIISLGEKLDPRIWPLGLSFLGTGLSIGIIVPVLPLLVDSLQIPPSQFGVVVSAFGLAKLVGNIPSAHWVERYGRKQVLVSGMLLCSLGIGTVGLAVDPSFGAPSLIISRLITGFGVSAFTSAAFMMLADISTSLNRTRTMSPVMASFQAGTALGPAIGGLAVTQLGIAHSYFLVGGMIGALSLANQVLLRESKPGGVVAAPGESAATAELTKHNGASSNGGGSSLSIALRAWRELVKVGAMRDVVLANTMYWVGLSGTSLTLLPLFMVGPDLHLTPAQIGLAFAFSSTVSVAASQPVAVLADKWGKEKCICAGLGVLGSSMIALPMAATSFESLLVVLAPVALGSTCLSAVPAALVGDVVDPSQRSQALALLRTAGDCGLLVGAIFSGLASTYSSIGLVMEVNGSLLLASAALWGWRRLSREHNTK